jgi:DNA-binding NtrC family response regulator
MKQGKILLVDDNATLLGKMQELLELHDFEVVPAGSVNEALNKIANQQFDVLITDLHMPDPGDGFTVVTAMRHAQPDVLTLVVSGFPDVQGAMAAILLQADEVLVKPIEVEQLAKLIQRRLCRCTPRFRQPLQLAVLQPQELCRSTNAVFPRHFRR